MQYRIPLQDWSDQLSDSYVPMIGNYGYANQTAHQPWSVQVLDANSARFEIRDNDRFWWDQSAGHAAERDELAANQSPIANGTPLKISYGFMVEPGAPNTAQWAVFGQLHQDLATVGPATSPPFEIKLVGEKLEIDIGYGSTADPQRKVLFLDSADIDRGHLYDMQITAVFDPAGNGRLVVVRDGVTLADYSGPLGYAEQQGIYWAEGIYRSDNATETMAVQYRNLQIATGSDVSFQSKDAFIDAPVLQVGRIAHAAGSSDAIVSIDGTAKAGSVVSIFEDGRLVAEAKVDATGHYRADVAVSGTGQHGVTARATDASGHDGILSASTAILVGTSADIVAKLGTLSSIPNLGAIVLTGDTLLHVSSAAQLSYAQRADLGALAKIAGGYSILYSQAATNAGYDRVDTAYASDGRMTEYMRYLGAKLVLDDVFASDGSHVSRSWSPDGALDRSTISPAGKLTAFEHDDANGKVTFRQEFRADGANTIHNFSTVTGLETSTSVYGADRSHVDTFYVQGQSYATQVYTYDAANHMTKQERFTATGTKTLSQAWNADGSRVVHNYAAATGTETSSSLVKADGSHVDTTFGITGKGYTTLTKSYDAAGRTSGQDTYDSAGRLTSSEAYLADGSRKVYAVAASGASTGYVLTAPDASHTDVAFAAPGSTLVSRTESYDSRGQLVSKEVSTFDSAGKVATKDAFAKDGSHTMSVYAGSVLVKTDAYDAAGRLVAETVFNNMGAKAAVMSMAADGAQTVQTLDPVTGQVASARTTAADGSWTETKFGIKGQAYTSATTSYDVSGRTTEVLRWSGDKLVYDQVNGSDGKAVLIKTWTDAGELTASHYNSAGALASTDRFAADGTHVYADIRNADGSREVHNFSAKTGLETDHTVYHTDGSREYVNLAVTGQSYATQHATYDKAGKLLDMVRHYGSDTGQIALAQHVHQDGSSEVYNYDVSGRELMRVVTQADQSHDNFYWTYSGASATKATAQQDHYASSGQKVWTDATAANGSHAVTAFASGQTFESHAGVADLFTSAGGDTFVFKAGFGQDVIKGFRAGEGAGHDVIQIDHALAADLAHLVIQDVGQNAMITLGAHDTITLTNVHAAQLTAHDFLFV